MNMRLNHDNFKPHNGNGVSRRNLLRAAPAAGLAAMMAGAIPVAASASHVTPVMAAYAEWQAYAEWMEGSATDGMTDEQFDPICDHRRKIEMALYKTPSQNATDTLAKFAAFTMNGRDFADDDGTGSGLIMAEMMAVVSAKRGAA